MNLCRHCQREWSGTVSCHCSGCHAHFSTPANFDAHRVNDRCYPPGDVFRTRRGGFVRPLLMPSEGPYGTTWIGYAETPTAEKVRAQ